MRKRSEVFSHEEGRSAEVIQGLIDGLETLKSTEEPPTDEAEKNTDPHLSPGLESVVHKIFQVDAHSDYEALEKALSVGSSRTDYASLLKAIDEAETNARKAHKLYLAAKLEAESWEIDHTNVMAGMRSHAVENLEREKAAGDRKKAITNADVEAEISALFPDEWKHQAQRRVQVKGTVEHLERLADLWFQRCKTLGTMIATLRK